MLKAHGKPNLKHATKVAGSKEKSVEV